MWISTASYIHSIGEAYLEHEEDGWESDADVECDEDEIELIRDISECNG